MRVMCDTNVLVRAVLSPQGAAAELLRRIALDHTLVTSTYQLTELLEVLRRPAISSLHGLDEHGIRRFVARLYKLAVVVPLPPDVPQVVLRDPKDIPILATAVAGSASVLCTLDRHFHEAEVAAYCTSLGVRILPDAELLSELRGS
jgi:putative PIN family toxin of toxin-antitoxin system